jgi:hypothetical protein
MGAMDYGAHKSNGSGCYSEAILELEGRLCEKTLARSIETLSNQFPILHGCVARDWLNLAPYWKVPSSGSVKPIPLRVVDLPADAIVESDRILDYFANEPLDSKWQHLKFILVRLGNDRSRLGMVFDHRLLDAFGAESILLLLHFAWQGKLAEIAPRISQTEPAHLDHWKRRFDSGKTLNRFLLETNQKSVCALNPPPIGVKRPVRFLHETLTKEETDRFTRRAAEEIGMPIILPSAAARALVAVRRAIPNFPLSGEQYLVFTTVNQRFPGQEWEKLLFNHLSLMSFSSQTNEPPVVPEIAIRMRDQFFEQTRQRIPFVMEDAGALGRICPHFIGSRLMRLVAGGRLCSFYFVCLRENAYADTSFLDCKVTNLIHKPLTFFPPGLNVCITSFANRFNLVVSYIDGTMSDEVVGQLMTQFKAGLQG